MGANEDCHYFCPSIDERHEPMWWRERLARFAGRLLHWHERADQRRDLAGLDDRLLKDIGLSRADAYRESAKWFWQD